MFEYTKSKNCPVSIEFIKEEFRDHPTMQRLNVFVNDLKKERMQDKVFYQSNRGKASAFRQ